MDIEIRTMNEDMTCEVVTRRKILTRPPHWSNICRGLIIILHCFGIYQLWRSYDKIRDNMTRSVQQTHLLHSLARYVHHNGTDLYTPVSPRLASCFDGAARRLHESRSGGPGAATLKGQGIAPYRTAVRPTMISTGSLEDSSSLVDDLLLLDVTDLLLQVTAGVCSVFILLVLLGGLFKLRLLCLGGTVEMNGDLFTELGVDVLLLVPLLEDGHVYPWAGMSRSARAKLQGKRLQRLTKLRPLVSGHMK